MKSMIQRCAKTYPRRSSKRVKRKLDQSLKRLLKKREITKIKRTIIKTKTTSMNAIGSITTTVRMKAPIESMIRTLRNGSHRWLSQQMSRSRGSKPRLKERSLKMRKIKLQSNRNRRKMMVMKKIKREMKSL